ncbi:MAG: response regulator transcription factor [Chloroflexi bacterium]|nr:response regulator transcription factor [Chloroflexota bacterium]OJV88908.1 MAG: DNA-binding response regulator [Chloroflexi bacterium 54-19]
MKPVTTVLLAEDHNLVRAGIRVLFQNLPEFEVIAEASDGEETLRLIETLRPNIVLMDITMPKFNGLEVAQAARVYPEVKIIILSMHTSEEYVWQALHAGVKGYLLKDAGIAELEIALKAVSLGQSYLSPAVSKQVIGDYIDRVGGKAGSMERLTIRQRQILKLIAEGNTTKQIADKLNISVKTIESHRGQIMSLLDIHDVTGLVRYAIRTGLISAET